MAMAQGSSDEYEEYVEEVEEVEEVVVSFIIL
jgi:translation elongation factor EF-1beta